MNSINSDACCADVENLYDIKRVILHPFNDDGSCTSWYDIFDIVATKDVKQFISCLKRMTYPSTEPEPTLFIFDGFMTNDQATDLYDLGCNKQHSICTGFPSKTGYNIIGVYVHTF